MVFGQVGAFVGEDGGQLAVVECDQRRAGDDDGRRPPRDTEGGGFGGIDDNQVVRPTGVPDEPPGVGVGVGPETASASGELKAVILNCIWTVSVPSAAVAPASVFPESAR